MKREQESELHALLDDVLPPGSGDACGPNLATVLELARNERCRRQQRGRQAAAAGAVFVLGAALAWTVWWESPEAGRDGIAITAADVPRTSGVPVAGPPADAGIDRDPETAEPQRQPVVIRQIDDDQLMALLQGAPAALMEWPNGERTLMLVERR